MKNLFGISLFMFFAILVGIFFANTFSNSSPKTITTVLPVQTSNNISITPSPGLTLAEVAKHNSAASCWLVVDNKIYDVTSFANQHSGGAGPILQSCGQDASNYFHSRHGNRELSYLSSFLIGTIK